MDLGLTGRRAAVAAGTAGLGFACAEALAAEGARVALCGSRDESVAAAVGQLPADTVGITADLTQPEHCARFVEQAHAALGGLDILVVNGPGPAPGTFGETDPGGYQAALDSSLLSVVRMCYAAVPGMRAQRWGRIVAITSISVRQPIPNLILSNTARAGATGFLKTLAREIAADGVTVNSVLPGLHRTRRVEAVYGEHLDRATGDIPAGVLGEPADFGALVTFLCAEQAGYITGVAIPVDGGQDRALI